MRNVATRNSKETPQGGSETIWSPNVRLKPATSQVRKPPAASQSARETSWNTSLEEGPREPSIAGSILVAASGFPGTDETVMQMVSMTRKTAISSPRTAKEEHSARLRGRLNAQM